MGFTNFVFFFFLVVVLFLYFVLPEKCSWIVLLAASWFFYAYGNLRLFYLLPLFSLVTYFSAIGLEKIRGERAKKALFIATLIVIFAALFFYKYFGLFAKSTLSIASLLGMKIDDFTLRIALPVGISFYTFQTASYVIDVYLGKVEAEKHFGYYALYVSFFPQLVAGPIERTDRLLPQLKVKHSFDRENIRCGLAMMASGYFKKLVVADVAAIAVNSVYNAADLSSLSGASVFVASALFFVQIYCDFSGYSDIAVGVARLMGIRLMKNFDRPFLSESVTEFWSRWHISLSQWFSEYVYRPLSFRSFRKKNKLLYYSLNTAIVMLLSGFWHGAEWSFLLWGAFLALCQIVEGIFKKKFPDGKRIPVLQRGITLFLLTLSMILFRAQDISAALTMYGRLFVGWNLSEFFTQTSVTLPYAVLVICGVVGMDWFDRKISFDGGEQFALTKNYVVYYFVVISVVLAVSYLTACGQDSSFIYFRF